MGFYTKMQSWKMLATIFHSVPQLIQRHTKTYVKRKLFEYMNILVKHEFNLFLKDTL